MGVSDYDNSKEVEVSSVSGTPTISKAQPVLFRFGSPSYAGFGEIVLDGSGVSSKSDVAFYDQNGNLLPFELEAFDPDVGGVAWVWNDWVRDDSYQLQPVTGNGPGTAEENVTGTWNNTGQNAVMVQHLQDDPLTATDSTSNDNDGTINGDPQSVIGQFDGAGDFDGTSDEITFSDRSYSGDEWFYVAWVKPRADEFDTFVWDNPDFEGGETGASFEYNNGGLRFVVLSASNSNQVIDSGSTSLNEMYHLVGGHKSNDEYEFWVDDSSQGTVSRSSSLDQPLGEPVIGARGRSGDNDAFADAVIDEVRMYEKEPTPEFVAADYDASPKGGRNFFRQRPVSGDLKFAKEGRV